MRTTIYLDEELRAKLERLVPPRGLSRFVNEAVAEKVRAMEMRRVQEDMAEGYLATRNDRDTLNEDWSSVDIEGWPE